MTYELSLHERIAELGADEWNALVGVDEAPFLSWEFLDLLERTGCVSARAGWSPVHLALRETGGGASGRGRLVLAAPAYLKTNSEGEFVFDHGWAAAAARAGLAYYPKLLVASPFTPATGRRLLVARGVEQATVLPIFAKTAAQLTAELGLSGAHVNFLTEAEARALERSGFALRLGVQLHWRNRGYGSFEDFLGELPQKRRTQIRRERREVRASGVSIATLRGREVRPELVDHLFDFYRATVEKFFWGRQYLSRAFFEEAPLVLGDRFEAVLANHGQKPIAAAINYVSTHAPPEGRALFGRYWGATEDRRFLHFEVCYYHSIESAIERGLSRFEPGAGGEHKQPRGFSPTPTYSVHMLRDPRLDHAVRDFLARERAAIERSLADEGDER